MSFKKDLELAKRFENITYDILNYKGYFPKWNPATTVSGMKPYDLACTMKDREVKIEVKTDTYTDVKSDNLCFEYECNYKPSGITTTQAEIYYYYSQSNLYVISIPALKWFLKTNPAQYKTLYQDYRRNSSIHLVNKDVIIDNNIGIKIPYAMYKPLDSSSTMKGITFTYYHNNQLEAFSVSKPTNQLYENLFNRTT